MCQPKLTIVVVCNPPLRRKVILPEPYCESTRLAINEIELDRIANFEKFFKRWKL